MNADKLNVAIVSHGRFHVFELAREIAGLGHNVVLISNYPNFYFSRHPLPLVSRVSFSFHLFLFKLLEMFGLSLLCESFLHILFSRWAAIQLKKKEPKNGWDCVLIMSGVAVDAFKIYKKSKTVCMLIRSSTHIVEQYNILENLSIKSGQFVSLPSKWMILREMEEYDISDVVNVPSLFALKGFETQGYDIQKCKVIPLGVNIRDFNLSQRCFEQRVNRVLTAKKIRVINTGNFSLQKGALDYADLIDRINLDFFEIRHVGAISDDASGVFKKLKNKIEFIGKVPQEKLLDHYLWADVFIILSVQDGFAVVVSQAMSMGLPIIATSSVGSSDLLINGVSGFVVPPGSSSSVLDALNFIYLNRNKYVEMLNNVYFGNVNRSWRDVAEDTVKDLIPRVHNKKSSLPV